MPTSGSVQSLRIQATGSIGSATTLSNIIDLMGYRPAAIDLSSGWEAANPLSFKGSGDALTFYGLYDNAGVEHQVSSAAIASATGRSIALSADLSLALAAHRYLRIQSGLAASPATHSTGVTFTIHLVPF